jgi:hypothetical protein
VTTQAVKIARGTTQPIHNMEQWASLYHPVHLFCVGCSPLTCTAADLNKDTQQLWGAAKLGGGDLTWQRGGISHLKHFFCQEELGELRLPFWANNGRKWAPAKRGICYARFLRRNKDSNKKFWKELIAYFPMIRHGPHIKRRLQQFFVGAGMYLPSCYISKLRGYRQTHRHASNNFSVACIRCRGNVFTEPLPSTHTNTKNDKRDL